MVTLLENLFHGHVDAQCGGGLGQALLQYVCGYASKASDSLSWKSKEYGTELYDNKWLLVYRLLCKRSPLCPEMFLDMATVPLMIHSYQTDTLYPPVPHYVTWVDGEYRIDGLKALPDNDHRKFYDCYLKRTSQIGVAWSNVNLSFLEYARLVRYDSESKSVKSRFSNRGRYCHKAGSAIGAKVLPLEIFFHSIISFEHVK